ncbi:MAG: glycosyltransferase family 2 protein [Chloroflexi bacterium]|nr:glycosyltransferase family 2 protein [Chloroflexota bacterium]
MKGERAPRVSVVIVNYNTRELLLSCLRSLKRSTEDLQIVVVDNASQDGSPEAVRTAFPEVQLLALPENQGFCRGNNIGIERSCGKYVLILNPDTEIESSTLTLMADFMDHNPEYDGCTGQLHHPKFSGGGGDAVDLLSHPDISLSFTAIQRSGELVTGAKEKALAGLQLRRLVERIRC